MVRGRVAVVGYQKRGGIRKGGGRACTREQWQIKYQDPQGRVKIRPPCICPTHQRTGSTGAGVSGNLQAGSGPALLVSARHSITAT